MTNNHNYQEPEPGMGDWHVPINQNFEKLDKDIEIRDSEVNKGDYEPKSGAKYESTDSGAVYYGNGESWVLADRKVNSVTWPDGVKTTAAPGHDALAAGNLVYVTDEGRGVIEPSETDTPVQDTINSVMNSGGGTVHLPPTTLQESSSLSYKGVNIVGQGIGSSIIEFTHGGDGIVASSNNKDLSYSNVDGVTIQGQNNNEITNGIKWDDDAGPQTNIGQIRFRHYSTGIHTVNDCPWSSHWKSIYGGYGCKGKTFHFEAGANTDLHLGQATIANDTQSTGFHIDNASLRLEVGSLQFERQTGNRPMIIQCGGGMFRLQQVQFEVSRGGTQDLTSINNNEAYLITTIGTGDISINQIRSQGMTLTGVVELQYANGNVNIGSITDNSDITESRIVATGDCKLPCFYRGPSSEVDNKTGSGLSNPIVCLGDLQKKTSPGIGS